MALAEMLQLVKRVYDLIGSRELQKENLNTIQEVDGYLSENIGILYHLYSLGASWLVGIFSSYVNGILRRGIFLLFQESINLTSCF